NPKQFNEYINEVKIMWWLEFICILMLGILVGWHLKQFDLIMNKEKRKECYVAKNNKIISTKFK
ncbi:MAG: hypothetical protein PHF88_02925, partial [Candidatus Pacebacteria bacterium]|nr:hypothetical protein [Candidatus Paceibacterota bacterium]